MCALAGVVEVGRCGKDGEMGEEEPLLCWKGGVPVLKDVDALGPNDGETPGPNVGVTGEAPPPSCVDTGMVNERRRFSNESVVPWARGLEGVFGSGIIPRNPPE